LAGTAIASFQENVFMKTILIAALVGVAVAGVIYYLNDREGAEKLMGDIKDNATDAFNKISGNLGKMKEKADGVMA
jgi:hypothetical protein